MSFDLAALFPGDAQLAQGLLACNDFTRAYGLALTRDQALELCETRSRALKVTGRVEFGGGILEKLAQTFAPSPFLSAGDWADALGVLVEQFYAAKTESGDRLTDDALIRWMYEAFNGPCRGSLDLLESRLDGLARRVRGGEVTEEDRHE